jgi:AraC family transcriptional regulator
VAVGELSGGKGGINESGEGDKDGVMEYHLVTPNFADMPDSILFVKNMVCHRCVLAVENALNKLAIPFYQVTVGEVHLRGDISQPTIHSLAAGLSKIGLELIDSRANKTIEKIKQLVIRKARNEGPEKEIKMKLSAYLTHHLHHEYTYLSSSFSAVEGRTIENYYIEQRIERVKELLVYNEMTLSEIAFQMEYSSVAHLSSQFKKITGLTPSHFKQVGSQKRKLLDNL